MKKLTLLLLTIILSAPVYAQKYLKVDVTSNDMMNSVITEPKLGYGYCQDNQIILLDLLVKDSRKNIHKLAVAIDQGQRFQIPKLYNLLIHQIMLVKIKQQLKTKSLYQLIQDSKKNKTLSVLQLDHMRMDIDFELLNALSTSLDRVTWSDLNARAIENLKEKVYKEMLNKILSGAYKVAVTAEVRAQIGRFMMGQLSKQVVNQAIKTTLLQVGKSLMMDVAHGGLIDILTLPLMGFTQAPEGVLVDAWEEAPELIINPEWINPAGSKMPARYAWQTHCLAILRKPKRLEYLFDKYRQAEQRKFAEYMEILPDLR
jgi:hypothetical protein